MKTTLDLPDDLMRAIKIRAAEENRRLKDVMSDLLRSGLAQPVGAGSKRGHRVKLPLIPCAHAARPEEEMTAERLAEVLLQQDVEDHLATLR